MIKTAFSLGFWHPFGPHSGESAKAIVVRKANEIRKNGWTLWSFQHRLALRNWYKEIIEAQPEVVYVFCSDGKGRDPHDEHGESKVVHCQRYHAADAGDNEAWMDIPSSIQVPHTFRGKNNCASAFIVQRILSPDQIGEFVIPPVEWLRKDGSWRPERIPTRGEYLIRTAKTGGTLTRKCGAILLLRRPYLAIVRAD
jgi:hypothetical protein